MKDTTNIISFICQHEAFLDRITRNNIEKLENSDHKIINIFSAFPNLVSIAFTCPQDTIECSCIEIESLRREEKRKHELCFLMEEKKIETD